MNTKPKTARQWTPLPPEEFERQEKLRMIRNILDYADDTTKQRVTPLLMELPLKRLQEANPYAGNASDDCHTYS